MVASLHVGREHDTLSVTGNSQRRDRDNILSRVPDAVVNVAQSSKFHEMRFT
jgi:hypothetical protein